MCDEKTKIEKEREIDQNTETERDMYEVYNREVSELGFGPKR